MTKYDSRHLESTSSSTFSDDTSKADKTFEARVPPITNRQSISGEKGYTQSHREHEGNRNHLNPHKNNEERLSIDQGSHYFPDHVARVAFVTAIVKADEDGNYIKDLQDGMKSLATRLAPSFFPGMVVRGISTQVDGYAPLACPSEEFTNCQDVVASIGLYLRAPPQELRDTDSFISAYSSATNEVDPLIAFQESFQAAIANNELQQAIQQEYLKSPNNSGDDLSPPVVVISYYYDGINAVSDVDVDGISMHNETEKMDEDEITVPVYLSSNSTGLVETDAETNLPLETEDIGVYPESSADVSDFVISEGDGFFPSIVAIADTEEIKKNNTITAGVVGTILISLFVVLASVLVVSRRRRKDNNDGPDTFLKGKKKIKRDPRRRNKVQRFVESNNKGVENESGRFLLRDDYINDSDYGDEEQGYTGRTMRTVETAATSSTGYTQASTHTHEVLYPVPSFDSSAYTLTTEETDVATTSDIVALNDVGEDNMNAENDIETKKNKNSTITAVLAATSNDLMFFDNTGSALSDPDKTLPRANSYDDDDDDEYVMCEDDASEGSVGQHLLSASKSSEIQQTFLNTSLCTEITTVATPDPPSPSVSELIGLHEARTRLSDADDKAVSKSPSDRSGSVATLNNSNHSVGSMEELKPLDEIDLAIVKEDWAAVGATAALIASGIVTVDQTSISERSKHRSSLGLRHLNEKAKELEKFIETGEWEAVVVAAAKYDVEGAGMGEDASRSCMSKTSTQDSQTHDSDANESFVSNMDYSSGADHSVSMGRSVTTSGSQKEHLQEIRCRVIELVRDVVPDEVDNVDEMMAQFKGKEDDLLETLRSMKERDIARKARLEAQKLARRKTRSREKDEDIPTLDETLRELEAEQPVDSDEIIRDLNGHYGPSDMSDSEEAYEKRRSVPFDRGFGSFDNVTKVDSGEAAASAAAWAIQRSLDEMMQNEK